MNCLWCQEEIVNSVCWESVFGVLKEKKLCSLCKNLLKPIEGNICVKCGRANIQEKCEDCIRWDQNIKWSKVLQKNRSVYPYSGILKEMIANWKYRGDAILVEVFAESLKQLAKNEFADTNIVVPIPISARRLYERTFNQAQLLAELLPFPSVEGLLLPLEQAKQSKKSRKQRLQLENNPFMVNKKAIQSLKGKGYLLLMISIRQEQQSTKLRSF